MNWSSVNVRSGLTALLVLAGAGILIGVFGVLGVTVAIAALFVLAADRQGSTSSRLRGDLTFIAVGAGLAFAGAWAGAEMTRFWFAGLLMAVVVYLATVAAALGKPAAVRGLMMAIWVVLALSLAGEVESPLVLAGSFVIGGLVAAVVILGQSVVGRRDYSTADEGRPILETLLSQASSPLGRYAVLRGLATGAGVVIGALFFESYPIWIAISVLVILREDREATYGIGVQRTAGTMIGVIVATGALQLLGDSAAVLVGGVVVSAFLTFALKDVHYAVFTTFLTITLVFALHVSGSDPVDAGTARLVETLIGFALAMGSMVLVKESELV